MESKYFNIDWDKVENKNKNDIKISVDDISYNINKPLTYFLPPPNIPSTILYQDVNKDKNLRNSMTLFYLNKTIKWINKYNKFKNLKYLLNKLESKSGYKIIYNILRQYVKKNIINWYDLKQNYYDVKIFIKNKLDDKY